jgi:hypothetical protein
MPPCATSAGASTPTSRTGSTAAAPTSTRTTSTRPRSPGPRRKLPRARVASRPSGARPTGRMVRCAAVAPPAEEIAHSHARFLALTGILKEDSIQRAYAQMILEVRRIELVWCRG